MTTVTLRTVLVALLAIVVTGASGGCGLGANDDPQPLDRENVPPAALDDEGSQVPSTGGVRLMDITVYFIQTDEAGATHLVSRAREVPWPGDPEARLQALITEAPDPAERADGISTSVPEDASLLSRPVHNDDGVLVVNLSENFYDLQGEASRNAFAQVVYTATEVPGVDAVRFELGGEPFEAVDGDGETRRGPVDRAAYRNLASD